MTESSSATRARERLALAYSTRTSPGAGFVIGCVGRDVPLPLISAAGGTPLVLRGAPGDTAQADAILGTGLDPSARSILQSILTGAYGTLDAIVVASDTDATQRLYYALREMRRVEPERGLPPVHLIDILHLPRESTTRYNIRRLHECADVLATWTGKEVTAGTLRSALARHAGVSRELAKVDRARVGGRLSGLDALIAVGARSHMEHEDYIECLGALSAVNASTPVQGAQNPRIFLTGSSHDSAEVYEAIEATGAVIVGDDHAYSIAGSVSVPDAAVDAQTLEYMLEQIARAYQYALVSPQRGSIVERGEVTAREAARAGADLVLSYVRVRDEAPLWDFASQRAKTSVPAAIVRDQPYGAIDAELLEAALRSPEATGVNR